MSEASDTETVWTRIKVDVGTVWCELDFLVIDRQYYL